MSTHGYVPIKVIALLPNGETGYTTVRTSATREENGQVTLFAPMIREVAERQLGLNWGEYFKGFTWHWVGEFIPD